MILTDLVGKHLDICVEKVPAEKNIVNTSGMQTGAEIFQDHTNHPFSP